LRLYNLAEKGLAAQIEVECESLEEVALVIGLIDDPGVVTTALSRVMLDNMSLVDMKAAVEMIGRALHSSTFRLNISTFCGTRCVHDSPPSLLDRWTRGGATKTA
jgi:nicotinate-nucleotide pyrophosphorylase